MDKVKFLTELNIQDIIGFIVEDTGIEYDLAMDEFYNSITFKKLTEQGTGIYRDSAAYVYELYKNEKKNGKLIQVEQ